MNHQPYEDWLFSEDELEVDQSKELQVHLKLCERCSSLAFALADAEMHLSSKTMIHPSPGFTSRWQARLQAQREVSFRRHTSILITALSLGTLVLFVPILVHWLVTALSPGDVLSRFLQDFVNWFGVVGFTSDVTVGVIDGMVDTIPLAWLFTFVFALLGLCSLWIFMMHRIRSRTEVTDGAHAGRS